MTTVRLTAPSAEGVASGQADLWCTYAAVRTLSWLGRLDAVDQPERTVRYLANHRNGDGGYGWSRGMTSDAWATYYCTQALNDLGAPPGPSVAGTAAWVASTWADGGYAMTPGQRPDVWATYFSVRTAVQIGRTGIPDGQRLLSWLGSLQGPDGGLAWSPDHAATGASDVRACYYGIAAWQAVHGDGAAAPPWDIDRLVGWIRHQQSPAGGFRLSPAAEIPCLWATYRATAALAALGATPRRPTAAATWTLRQRGSSGAFVRWTDYGVEDVWASFCAVGALRALGAGTDTVVGPVTNRLRRLALGDGGYTYREPELAADALTTAAAVLAPSESQRPRARERRAWLENCLLPNECGVMYMPGRGSEVRCTLWALAAGTFAGDDTARARVTEWLAGLQNPDGGFGYWEGRASDMVSTVSAIGSLRLIPVEPRRVLNTLRLGDFLNACRAGRGGERHADVPGAAVSLRASLQALRVKHALGWPASPEAATAILDDHRVPGGGYANEGNRLPDLLSTYEAVLTSDHLDLDVDVVPITRFLDRIAMGDGAAWTPLAARGGGPLADCLATLLRRRLSGRRPHLPPLTLS